MPALTPCGIHVHVMYMQIEDWPHCGFEYLHVDVVIDECMYMYM